MVLIWWWCDRERSWRLVLCGASYVADTSLCWAVRRPFLGMGVNKRRVTVVVGMFRWS